MNPPAGADSSGETCLHLVQSMMEQCAGRGLRPAGPAPKLAQVSAALIWLDPAERLAGSARANFAAVNRRAKKAIFANSRVSHLSCTDCQLGT